MIIKIFLNISIPVQRRQRLISKLIIMNFYNYSRLVMFSRFMNLIFLVPCIMSNEMSQFLTQFIFSKTITVEKIKNTTFLIKKRIPNKFNHTLAIIFFPKTSFGTP